MSAHRIALLAWLASSRTVGDATGVLRHAIEDTQSGVAMELAGWHELLDDLDLGEEHSHVLMREVNAVVLPAA